MKSKKRSSERSSYPGSSQRQSWGGYDPVFKRTVILFAEQKGIREGSIRFNLPEITIRRWKRIKNDIMEKAQQNAMENIRRSQRHTGGESGESSAEKRNSSENMILDLSNDIDSMPLEKRLSQNHNELPVPVQDTVLQSQSISPTKLKVTRQGRLNLSSQIVTPPLPPEVCLKWNTQHLNMQSAFPNLLMKGQYVDATLVSEGKTMKCHRMVLSMCSPYFEEILNGIGPFQHPVLFMKDVPFWILKSLCDFMYAGEIRVSQDKLDELLNVATLLKIKGLAGIPESAEQVKTNSPNNRQESESFPKIHNKPPKLEEAEEKPTPPTPPRTSTPNLLGRSSRHHHSGRFSKHKVVATHKDEAFESPKPLSLSRRREEKKAKLALGRALDLKDKGKNIEQTAPENLQANVSSTSKRMIKPSTLRPSHTSRRRSDKNKIEINVTKEEDTEKEKPPLRKDNINDPLDLLQPVYEEIAKDETPMMVKNVLAGRLKERNNVPTKKGTGRKVRKRRYIEYKEDLDDSSPIPFQSRKGTRSRPNVKVPKFFHTPYDDSPKDSTHATIVREPHTDHDDPLIEEVGEIKVEPVDVEENSLSWTPQDQEEEEIMGNYDSPLVNVTTLNSPNTSGVINIKQEKILMDINQFNKEMNESIVTFNSTEPAQEKSGIMITNIHSMADVPEELPSSDNGQDNSMENVQSSEEVQESAMDTAQIEKVIGSVAVKPLEALTLHPRESRTSSVMIFPTVLLQVEADPLAEIGGPDANHATGTLELYRFRNENARIGESRHDILVLEKDHSTKVAEDSVVQPQGETLEKETILSEGEVVLECQEILNESEQVECLNIGEIKPNDDKPLQIEETQTAAEENKLTEASTNTAAIRLKQSLGTEIDTFENVENLKGSEEALDLTENMEETFEEQKNLELIDPIEETKTNALEDSNSEENLAAPSRKNIKQPNGDTSHLNKDNLELQPINLLSEDSFTNEDIVGSAPHIPESKNDSDEEKNIVEFIEASNLNIGLESEDEEVAKHTVENSVENVKEELQKSVDGGQKKVVLIQQETESNKHIEPEQCFASSSTPASPKTTVKRPSFNVQLLPINNEDFTKDIELDKFTPSNIHANNLGDSKPDFNIGEARFEKSKSKKTINDEENETELLEYKNDEKKHARMGSHNNELDVAKTLETESILVHENLASDTNSPLDEVEVDLRMEECLLADLDEDVEMQEATTSQIEEDDGTEKTLEMIVNDLNESLGEMK